jgi:hypothetical protein
MNGSLANVIGWENRGDLRESNGSPAPPKTQPIKIARHLPNTNII